MDGVEDDDNTGVVVIGATNTPWVLDKGFLRRFEQRIYVPLPELQDRLDLLKILLTKNSHNLTNASLKDLASKTRGCSCHDIKMVIKDAFRRPISKVRTATHFRKVSTPSHKGLNVLNHNMWEPCSPNDPHAQKKSWHDLDEHETAIPLLTEVNSSRYESKILFL
ncbi:hypothetical protein WR25_00787 isoform B [Diploscapter pachys]|uniref:ATPase AAA-type core domain-containing protein n=1 Tax=Diploscapter pachys TaxID=2018661 RepID=A0A2A2KIA8_9BILA|nr:hypothetical protein WR25_00787 isoform B [Diploscapter pachys]